MGYKYLLASCDHTLCNLCCEKFDFDPSGIVVNSEKVCLSSILKQIHANALLGQPEKDDSIKGFFGSGSSFAQEKRVLTMSLMATDSPGHQTDIWVACERRPISCCRLSPPKNTICELDFRDVKLLFCY